MTNSGTVLTQHLLIDSPLGRLCVQVYAIFCQSVRPPWCVLCQLPGNRPSEDDLKVHIVHLALALGRVHLVANPHQLVGQDLVERWVDPNHQGISCSHSLGYQLLVIYPTFHDSVEPTSSVLLSPLPTHQLEDQEQHRILSKKPSLKQPITLTKKGVGER